ncbi:hypothetical protein ACFSHQ_10250 [Gemmobacter lanyuensis]
MALPNPPKVAMLTASEEDDEVMQALKAGALGYVLKGVGSRELVGIVKDLARGQSYVSPSLAGRLLAAMRGGRRRRPPIRWKTCPSAKRKSCVWWPRARATRKWVWRWICRKRRSSIT